MPISLEVSNFFTLLFFIIGIFFIDRDKRRKKQIAYYVIFSASLTFFLLYNSSNVVDFGLYHAPYISILNNEKIIFGLANIHFRFGHASILQNSQAIFNNILFYPNNFQTLSAIFYFSFLINIFHFLINKKNLVINKSVYLLLIFIFILLCAKIYRFNSFGNDLLPNILNFYIWVSCLIINFEKKNRAEKNITNKIIILLFIYLFSLLLKLQSLISFIPILYIIIVQQKKIIVKKILLVTVVAMLPIFSLFLAKNFINSGCLIYPAESTCFKKIKWSTNTISSEANPKKINIQSEAWAKGWPQRKNLDINYEEYNSKFNWIHGWLFHFKIILQKLSIPMGIIFVLIFLISSFKRKKFFIHWDILNFFCLSLFPLLFWFFMFPIYRYGYSNIYLSIFLFLLIIIYPFDINVSKFKIIKKTIYLFLGILILLNFPKILSGNSPNYWPNIYDNKLEKNIRKNYQKFNLLVSKEPCFYTGKICTNYELGSQMKIKKINNYLIFYF